MSTGAVITNRAGALFDVQGAAPFRGPIGGILPHIDNAGTFRISAGTLTSVGNTSYPLPF